VVIHEQKLERLSPEWIAELNRMIEAGERWMSNNNDEAAWDQFMESSSRLGFIVPNERCGK